MSLTSTLKNSALVRWVFRTVFITGDTVRLATQLPTIRDLLPDHAECALDAGAGSGEYTRGLLLPRADSVMALDLDAEALGRLEARLSGDDAQRCLLTAGSVTELPYADDTFDLVLCSEVIEHCEDDRAVARELCRVIRPGGSLVVSVPVPPAPYDDPSHIREGYTAAEITALLEESGFSVVDHKFCMFKLSRAALRLRSWAAPVPLPLMVIVHLERWLMRRGTERDLPFDVVVCARKTSL